MTRESYVLPDPPPTPTPAPFEMVGVIVCDNYADFLAQTLPHNKMLFDKIVVVTSYEDKQTQKLCEFWHVQVIKCDDMKSRMGEFHKGKGIQAGLDALGITELGANGWAIHLDADMYLPPQTRILLQQAELDPTMLYGIDRFLVRGASAWTRFMESPSLQHEDETYIHMNAFPIGTRVMIRHSGGYVPIGFFQLWNPSGSKVFTYPTEHTNAGRGDTLFAQQWPRAKRGFLPEIVGYHLESDDASNAANWNGRQTSAFTMSR